MIDAKDRVVQNPHRYQLVPVSGEADTFDIIRKPGSVTEEGTFTNRAFYMAMQGFLGQTTVFEEDGSITETNSEGQTKTTVFEEDGSITETFCADGICIAKQTIFEEDGSITEVML